MAITRICVVAGLLQFVESGLALDDTVEPGDRMLILMTHTRTMKQNVECLARGNHVFSSEQHIHEGLDVDTSRGMSLHVVSAIVELHCHDPDSFKVVCSTSPWGGFPTRRRKSDVGTQVARVLGEQVPRTKMIVIRTIDALAVSNGRVDSSADFNGAGVLFVFPICVTRDNIHTVAERIGKLCAEFLLDLLAAENAPHNFGPNFLLQIDDVCGSLFFVWKES